MMQNEEAMDIDSRVSKMSEDEIYEILIDKEGWQESMYERAKIEAKNRGITIEKLRSKIENSEINKAEILNEPLTKSEIKLFLFVPIKIIHWAMAEKYRGEGSLKKLEQMKYYSRLGKGIWLVTILALVFVWGLFNIFIVNPE